MASALPRLAPRCNCSNSSLKSVKIVPDAELRYPARCFRFHAMNTASNSNADKLPMPNRVCAPMEQHYTCSLSRSHASVRLRGLVLSRHSEYSVEVPVARGALGYPPDRVRLAAKTTSGGTSAADQNRCRVEDHQVSSVVYTASTMAHSRVTGGQSLAERTRI